jgi:hypothetical protein
MNLKFFPYNDNRIALEIQYDRNIISGLKEINQCRWHADRKVWSFPDTQENLDYLLKNLCEQNNSKVNSGDLNHIAASDVVEEMKAEIMKEIRIRSYSRRTGKMYVQFNEDFLKFHM